MRVDLHAHQLLPETLGKAGDLGPEIIPAPDELWWKIGKYSLRMKMSSDRRADRGLIKKDELKETQQTWTPEQVDVRTQPQWRVEQMDKIGWDVHGVTTTPLFYMYWAPPEVGVPYAKLTNDALAAYCAPFPDRLFFMATLPMQDPAAAAAEVDRAVGIGAKGINLGGRNLGGRELDDPAFFPVWERVVAHGLPIFIHGYPMAAAEQREDPYGISAFDGYLYDESCAFFYLIFGGVLDRFPALQVYLTHGGGFVPYHLSRFDAQSYAMSDMKNEHPVKYYLEHNFYVDLLLLDAPARRAVLEMVPVDRILWGSNFAGGDDFPGPEVAESLPVSPGDKDKILGGNAAQLFKLG